MTCEIVMTQIRALLISSVPLVFLDARNSVLSINICTAYHASQPKYFIDACTKLNYTLHTNKLKI